MWKSQTLFLTFPSIVRKVWENPDAFTGFFHAFPQYAISIKHARLPTDSFIDPKFLGVRDRGTLFSKRVLVAEGKNLGIFSILYPFPFLNNPKFFLFVQILF